MRKPNLIHALCVLLVLSLAANVFLFWRQRLAVSPLPLGDSRLVGSWKSRDPAGYRVVFLSSGQFVVTNFGTPYGPAGKWCVQDHDLVIEWAMDEEGGPVSSQKTSFKLLDGNTKLELAKALFSSSDAKTYYRASGEP